MADEPLLGRIARIISPTAFQLSDELERARGKSHAITGEAFQPDDPDWTRAAQVADQQCAIAMSKAQQILELVRNG